MAYLIIRADGSGEKYCEEYHATEGEMLEAVTDYECQVCSDVQYVIWSNEEKKTVGRLDRDELQARITDGNQQAEEERETEEFNSRVGDNLIKAITQVGRVVVSMIHVLDDTPKVVRIIGEDGETKEVGINGMIVQGQEQTFDLKRVAINARKIEGDRATFHSSNFI